MAGHAIETKEECWRSLVSESALHVKDTINGWNERMPPLQRHGECPKYA